MNTLSARLAALSPSQTLAMSQKSNELKAKGIDVINLSVGEPDFPTPTHIKDAAKKAIDDNITFYSPVPGFMDLRKAICRKLKQENSLDYQENQIVVSNGAKQSICNTLLAIVNKGDEVIIPAPYWVSYPEMVKLAEGSPVILQTSIHDEFKITAKALEETITTNTKALILCSPSNPTGSVYTRDELRALAEVVAAHPRLYVISDEIYEHIRYEHAHESIAQFEEIRDRVIIVNGVSKGYAMTGWRIGWIAADANIAKACQLLQGQYTSGASSVSQMAALEAYTGEQSCVSMMRKAFERRRDLIVRLMSEIPGIELNNPAGAFYLFPKIDSFLGATYKEKTIHSSTDLAMYILEEAHVACVAGDAFGGPEYIRLSYATSDENIIEAVARLKKALDKLSVDE